jgi:hypothetical protein
MIWKAVVGFEGLYEVSSSGLVRKVHGLLLAASPDSRGYPKVWLIRNGKGFCPKVHRLVAAAFLGPCPEGKETNHKDGEKRNNRSENLEYVTHKENVAHSIRHGLYRLGSSRNNSVLTEALVRKMRKEYKPYVRGLTIPALAEKYGLNQRVAHYAVTGRTWKHVI